MSVLTVDTVADYGTIGRSTSTSPIDSDSEATLPGSDGPGEPLLAKHSSGYNELSLLRTCVTIFCLSGVTFCASVSSGLLTVGLPVIARDLQLPEHLLLWPSSAYSLACACCLLLSGSIADKAGDRLVNLVGSAALAIFVLANGLASNSAQLIASRTLQGVGVSMCLPTGVSIITRSVPPGRARNIGFSCLGVAQPLGFSLGLVMEGGVEAAGHWRLGYYICAAILAGFLATNWVNLPKNAPKAGGCSLTSLTADIDWVGILVSSVGLGLISYTCAILAEGTELLWRVGNMTAMLAGLTLLATFSWWMKRQERLQRPALIPNSIWRNRAFLSISFTVLLAWASLQSSELLMSLFFQRVQLVAPLDASLRLLPSIVVGFVLNPVTGICVPYFTAYKLLAGVSLVAASSPLMMTFINPAWSWWVCAFWAVALGPVSVDVLFTMAHLVITDVFPSDMHALAGAVFNTVAQLGTSLGMSLVAVVSNLVIKSTNLPDKESPEALMAGYRAAFLACFILMFLSTGTSFGLRSLGKLGRGGSEIVCSGECAEPCIAPQCPRCS